MRYLYETLNQFAKDKFVLISGPRQVGKTTLAKHWLKEHDGVYLDWDTDEDREAIMTKSFLKSSSKKFLVFDEIHKYHRWKRWIKGLYDVHHEDLQVIVTGSARLDIFQKGGDSLFGRHEYLRMHPFSMGELIHGKIVPPPVDWLRLKLPDSEYGKWLQLERMSGFPDPFLKNDELYHNRWLTRRRNLLVKEDVREITQVKTLSLIEHLTLLLPKRVGSPLSINVLKEELQVAHDTISAWLRILEHLYFCFRISPYHKKIARGLKKEQKLYLWDWSVIENSAARFENMVASHLLKSIHAWNDIGYGEYSLHYVRDKEKNEIDFLIAERNKPVVLVECKLNETNFSFSKKLIDQFGDIPMLQLVSKDGVDDTRGRIRIVSAHHYLASFT